MEPINVHPFFSSIATKYDKLNRILSLTIDKSWRKKTMTLIPMKKQITVLDLCCGTGDMLVELRKRLSPTAEIIGLDFNENMLALAHDKIEKSSADAPIRLIQGNAYQTPFSEQRFDYVTIAFGLRNLHDTKTALAEIQRILKPGGRLIILELSKPEKFLMKHLHHFYLTKVMPLIGYLGTRDKAAYTYLRDSVKDFYDKKSLESLMKTCGFRETGYLSLTGGVAAIHFGKR